MIIRIRSVVCNVTTHSVVIIKINVLANTYLRQNDAIVEIRKLMLASYSAIYTFSQSSSNVTLNVSTAI